MQCGLDPLHSQERGVGLQNPELGGGLDNKKLPAPTHSTERSRQCIVYSVYCTGSNVQYTLSNVYCIVLKLQYTHSFKIKGMQINVLAGTTIGCAKFLLLSAKL